MTVYTSLRSSIVGVLETVPNIGEVNGRERFVVDPSKFLDFFKTIIGGQSQIRAWLVLRESATAMAYEQSSFGETLRRHHFVLHGFLGFKDADDTYGTMQALCDSVMAAFDNEETLGVTGVVVHKVGPCSLRTFGTAQFGSVLCHSAEIELPIDVILPLGTA
jgi:hypothetical protein